MRRWDVALALAGAAVGAAGCGDSTSAGPSDDAAAKDAVTSGSDAPASDAIADGGGDGRTASDAPAGDATVDGQADTGGDGGAACIPRVTPHGITALDATGRVLNARGIHLVDWDGFVANAYAVVTLRPSGDIAFPATATLTANHPRFYFDLPSTVGAGGPSKTVTFAGATSTVDVRLGMFPDRDGADEHYALTLTLSGSDPRPENVPVTIHDQDLNQALISPIAVDFGQDKTTFFTDAQARQVVQQAADDWSYFVDDMHLDPVPAMDESTFIWNSDGFVSGSTVTNAAGYTGFLLYGYGIHSSALRSGGEGSSSGKFQTSGGQMLPLRRSGGLEVETQGNYNTLGWLIDGDPDHWWVSGNQGSEQNDLIAIVHHEMGHAHGFNGAYPQFVAARTAGLSSPAILAYNGGPITIDGSDHFATTVDPSSGFGAFGHEYFGLMPQRRWIITRIDVLALEAVGYKVRGAWGAWQDTVPDCP